MKIKKIEQKSEPKTILGKIWNFLWKDESIWSWIVSLVLAFLLVKFIFFPGLSLLLGTSMPLVVVESSSMHHSGSFLGNILGLQDDFEIWWQEKGSWYLEQGISKLEAEKWPLRTGFEMGDIILVTKSKNLEIGDIIIFEANQKHPLIHRIVEIKNENNELVYETKGDNNSGQLTIEKSITRDKIIGKAQFKIPKLGWVKLGFVKLFQGF